MTRKTYIIDFQPLFEEGTRCEPLPHRGIQTVQEAGRRGSSDVRVMADATADGRAVLTHNRDDFKQLHRHNPQHAGIVSCTPDEDSIALASRIDTAVQSVGDLTGKHIRINLPSTS
jgi:hypothetical protein